MQDLTRTQYPPTIINFEPLPKFAINLKTVPVDHEYHDGNQVTTVLNAMSFYPPTADQLYQLQSPKIRKVVVMGE
jgi:hypothetical protein